MNRAALITLIAFISGCQAARVRTEPSDAALEAVAAAAVNARAEFAIIAHNIANIQTTGFKASRIVREELPTHARAMRGGRGDEVAFVGNGVRVSGTRLDMSPGEAIATGRSLDLMIFGSGFFRVRIPECDGAIAYTRAGSLHLDADGEVRSAAGHILEPSITIPSEAGSISITPSGEVSVMLSTGTEPAQVGQLEFASFADPGSLLPIGNGCYLETASSGSPRLANPGSQGMGSVRQGFLEQSNVILERERLELARTEATLRTLQSIADGRGSLSDR